MGLWIIYNVGIPFFLVAVGGSLIVMAYDWAAPRVNAWRGRRRGRGA